MWCALEEVYKGWIGRQAESMVLRQSSPILSREEKDFDVIPLKISQATAKEQFDQKLATHLHETGHEEALQARSVLSNDGTNACTFSVCEDSEHNPDRNRLVPLKTPYGFYLRK